jgi:peptide deformylase
VGKQNVAMLNPQIVKHSEEYSEVMEGCLSLLGERPAKRYEWIEVEYKDIRFKPQKQRFSGFTAQIIQHEIDHCQGILI